MTNPAVAALITALSSLFIAIFSYFATKKNQREVSRLQEQNAIKDAFRDYEYEARKRLYHEYEPLLFQLVEFSQIALHRIYNIARMARLGKLLSKDGFSCDIYKIGQQGGVKNLEVLKKCGLAYETYYSLSSIYYLLAPLVEVRLIQDLLTLVDLTLDKQVDEQYTLAKMLYKTFNDDFNFAEKYPKLEYDPNSEGWAEKRKMQPQIYWRQGVVAGELEVAVRSMIRHDSSEKMSRCISFGEFEDAFFNQNSELCEKLSSFSDLFLNFHPKTRPILWRILVTQAHIYKALLYTRKQMSIPNESCAKSLKDILLTPYSPEDCLEFDWRQRPDEANDEEVFIDPFRVAQIYLRSYWEESYSLKI